MPKYLLLKHYRGGPQPGWYMVDVDSRERALEIAAYVSSEPVLVLYSDLQRRCGIAASA